MSTATNPTITISNPECPNTILPTQADLVNLFNQLAALPSKLVLLAYQLGGSAQEEILNIAQEIVDFLEGVSDIVKSIAGEITDPFFVNFKFPEIEWERKIQALIRGFHNYVMKTILSLIDAILPVNFTINILGIDVDLLNLVTNPAQEFASIAAQIETAVDEFFDMLPDQYKFFGGQYGIDALALKIRAVLDYIMLEASKGFLGLIHDMMGGLIELFDTIWDALGLPDLIDLFTFDVDSFISNIIDTWKNTVGATVDDLLNTLLEVQIFGFSVLDIIGGEIVGFLNSPETAIRRIILALKEFSTNWYKKLLFEWMDIVTEFLEEIGLGSIVEWLTFTFCDFLNLIGFPTTIDLDNKYVQVT